LDALAELLSRMENGHKKFVKEQYDQLLESIIPSMLSELEANAKLCLSRLPPERVKAKFYRNMASMVRKLEHQVKVETFLLER
jgi:hypothetical protein